MNVKSLPYEYSGAPKKVAADCEVAKIEIATVNIPMPFEERKKSRELFIFVRLNKKELIARIKK